jgi:hypothetical protein
MPLLNLKELPYRWLVAELLVIVLGVLIAFQVEEWRTERQDRDLEREILNSILSELELREDSYQRYIDSLTLSSNAIGEFDSYLRNGNERSEDEVVQLYRDTWQSYLWGADSPTYLSWRDSGRVDIISDDDLRSSIYDYFSIQLPYIGYLTRINQENRKLYVESSLKDIYRLPTQSGLRVNELGISWRVEEPVEAMPRDSQFFPLMNNYGSQSLFIISRLKISVQRNRDLLQQISAHLETL